MANPSVTYTFTNSTTADGTQVSQNFTDLINGMTDGTKSFSIDALTVGGTALFNGAVTLGNASGDDITVTGSLASAIPVKTNNSFDIGDTSHGLRVAHVNTIKGSSTAGVGILGMTDGSAVATGYIGELLQAVGQTNLAASYMDILSLSLTAGEWLVSYSAVLYCNGANAWTEYVIGFGTATGNNSQDLGSYTQMDQLFATAGASAQFGASDSVRVTVTATQITIHNGTDTAGTARTGTTIYLKGYVNSTANGPQFCRARLTAQRVR